ncbi:hypothetical protein CRUP_034737, partial [Coryphaenoides rupestris]
MASVPRERRRYLAVLFSVSLSLLRVSVQQRGQPITVALEEGMVLECRCPWDGNLSLVSWTKSPNATKVAVLHPVHGESFAWRYQQRVEFPRRVVVQVVMVLVLVQVVMQVVVVQVMVVVVQ